MKIKLISDSSANICRNIKYPITYVPLKIITDSAEYTDNIELNVDGMLSDLSGYKGKSSTSCPSVDDWLRAFDNADIVFGTAISGNISGSYNCAMIAANEYTEQNPTAKVFIMDTLSAGPELELLLEKFEELINQNLSFEEIRNYMIEYSSHTHLLFSLSSLENFVRNGRVNPLIAKAVGILGLRVTGRASDEGTLEPLNKCRGEEKAIATVYKEMLEAGYCGSKVRISHTKNEAAAQKLKDMITENFKDADVSITENRALCSFYAEPGGFLVAFEDR